MIDNDEEILVELGELIGEEISSINKSRMI